MRRKKLKCEDNDYLQKTHDNCTKTSKLQAPCSKYKTNKPIECPPYEHCALCGWHRKHNKSTVPNVSHILTKIKCFYRNQHLTCANYDIYVSTIPSPNSKKFFHEMASAPR